MKILLETLNELPDTFTSQDFTKLALANGYPEHIMKKKGFGRWLKKYADNQYHRSKIWTKKTAKTPKSTDGLLQFAEDFKQKNPIQDAIDLLKKNGYKIYKTELTEI